MFFFVFFFFSSRRRHTRFDCDWSSDVCSSDLDKEVDEAVEEDIKKEEPVIQDRNLGSVEGKILRSGRPLPGCQVKLQMLEKGGLLTKGYRPVEGAVENETV